jgi:hypothetical protein
MAPLDALISIPKHKNGGALLDGGAIVLKEIEAGAALFRPLLLPPPLDLPRDLLMLLSHLREAVLPQAIRPRPVPFRRLLAALLAIGAGACVPSGE